jgi:hypothetical protein
MVINQQQQQQQRLTDNMYHKILFIGLHAIKNYGI